MAEPAIPEWAKESTPAAPKKKAPTIPLAPEQLEKVKAYAAETDTLLGLKPGTSLAQIYEESRFNPNAVSKAGAQGLAQVMPKTKEGLERIHKRKLDPYNIDDALFMHREVMKGNMRIFKNQDDALRGYNAGLSRDRWNNPETQGYVPKITNRIGRIPGVDGGTQSPLLQTASTTPQPSQQQAVPDWARDTNAVPDWAKDPLPQEAQAPAPGGYKPFAPVRKDIDEATLNKDPDFIRASMLMYELFERKKFEGSGSAAAEYGKNGIAAFNYNLVDLAVIGKKVTSEGTQEQKEAFLYMLDTYENTNVSWNGFKRAAWQSVTDPTNLVGVGALATALGGKFLARKSIVEGIKTEVKQSIKGQVTKRIGESVARTGMVAGIDTAVAMAATDATKQGVAVSAGRQKEVDTLQVAKEGGKGFVFGLVGGTALDATVAKIYRTIRGKPEVSTPGAKAAPEEKADFTVDPQGNVRSTAEAPAAAAKAPDASLVNAAKEFDTLKEFEDAYKLSPATPISRYSFSADGTAYKGKSLYHGTAGDNAFSILDAGEISARVSPGDKLGEQVVSMTPYRQTANSVGTVAFEIDPSKINTRAVDPEKVFKGDAPKDIEVRSDSSVPLSAVKRMVVELGAKEGPDTVLTVSGAKRTVVDLIKMAEGKGIEVVVIRKDTDLKAAFEAAKGVPSTAPLGSTLTPAEIAAATARKQQGRLPEDNVVPPMTGNEPRLKVPFAQTGLRDSPMSLAEQAEKAAPIVEQIRQIKVEDLPGAMEMVRRNIWDSSPGSNIMEEFKLVSRALQDHADELSIREAELTKLMNGGPNSLGYDTWAKELAEIQARKSVILADDATGTFAGQLLRQRQEGLGDARGITVESIMAEKGIPRAEAEVIWADTVTKAQQSAEVKKMEAAYEAKAQEALAEGDLTQAAIIAAQKRFEAAAMGEQIASGSASWSAKLTEAAISNVFSIKTVLINLIPSGIKTLVIPSLKFMAANPMEKAARAELAASYSAMASAYRGAWNAAVAGYKYEQALLTRDGARLLEEGLAIEGRKGGIVRFFPRILNASDEFLSRLNYDSFVAGRAAAEAAIEGATPSKRLSGNVATFFTEEAAKRGMSTKEQTAWKQSILKNGLTGKDLDTFIKWSTKNALNDSRGIDNSTELVQPIINKGVNLGLTGDDLFKYVEAEAIKNPQALLKGTDDEALNFVRDVLYKRQFSGEGNASKAAQSYEEVMRKFPSAKLLLGQLFFRTPIRVFEEGVRLTPGLQLIAPNFIADLAGKNGALRQVRAQSEAMTSLAITGAVLSLYAQGRITGDGAYSDWKQQRNRTDGPQPEPYTIKMSDGSTWSYRGFDPIATPIKIMINGLERLDRLYTREAQGEFVNKTEFDAAQAYVTVGTTAIAAAIRDANLVAGLNTTISFAENLADPERKEDAWLKYMGEKLFLAVPNTLHKIAKDNDPTIRDPATFWQVLDQTLARPFGRTDKVIRTAFSYDVLGNPRRASDTGALWNVFSTATPEERAKGLSPEAQIVLTELDRLSKVTGATFKPPMKHPDLGDLDLRTVMSSDGSRTLYDVWQDNYRNLKPEIPLAALAQAPLPDGTFKVKAAKVEEMQQVIKEFQDAAFAITMKQEEKVMKRFIDQTLNEAKAKAGLFDMNRPK